MTLKIKPLTWDTEFFGRKVGKLEIDREIGPEELKCFEKSGFDSVYIFSALQQPFSVSDHLPLMDKKVTLLKENFDEIEEGSLFFSPSRPTPLLEKLFLQSGQHSRFKLDNVFSPEFEALYGTWLRNSLSGEFADHVICAGTPGSPEGIVVLKKNGDALHISIIAVAESHRGQRIGKKLIGKAVSIAKGSSLSSLTVDTQEANFGAVAFYKKMGFTVCHRVFIYHWHRDG